MTRRDALARIISDIGALLILIPTAVFVVVVLVLYAIVSPCFIPAEKISARCAR